MFWMQKIIIFIFCVFKVLQCIIGALISWVGLNSNTITFFKRVPLEEDNINRLKIGHLICSRILFMRHVFSEKCYSHPNHQQIRYSAFICLGLDSLKDQRMKK